MNLRCEPVTAPGADGPADWQALPPRLRPHDDLGHAEREVQVLRVLPCLAEDPLQDLAASGGVLFGQPVEQVEGVVVIEGARSPRPTQEPYPSPLTRSVVVPPGDPDITGQTAKRPRRAWLTRIRGTRCPYCPSPALVSR